MAERTFTRQPLNILGGVAQVEQILGAREGRDLARQRLNLAEQQIETENIRQAEQDRIAAEARQFARLGEERDRNEQLLLDPKISANADIVRRLVGRNNQITTTLNPNSVDIDPEIVVRDIQSFQKDIRAFGVLKDAKGEADPDVQAIFNSLQNKYMFDPKRAAVVERAGAEIAGEEAFERRERRAGVTAERVRGEAVEAVKAKAAIGVEAAETERERKAAVIKGLGLDPELEKRVLASVEAGVTLPDPQAQARAKAASNIQTLQVLRQQLTDIDEATGDFIVTGAERAQMESLRKSLLNRILGAVSPGRTVKSIKNQKKVANFEDLLTQLASLEPVGDLNPADFLDDILADKKNFTNGNFKFTNDQILRKYEELLALRRTQLGIVMPPTPLTPAPPATKLAPEQVRGLATEEQKAIQGR
jgi:hypothetical protein